MTQKVPKPIIRKIVNSPYLDLFGALLVFSACIFRDFHQTIYFNGAIQFNIPNEALLDHFAKGAFPLGILSTIGAVFSLLSTRLIGKQKNSGNFIGILTTINSGVIDFMFGNASAIITYPITFIIHNFTFFKWAKGTKIRERDNFYYLILVVGLILGFILVFLGAKIFGGRTDIVFLISVSIIFGLSLGANFSTAFKYEETWFSWVIYNIVQLFKNTLQMNIANIAKYIFYLFNAAVTLVDWKVNRDAPIPARA